MSDHKICHRCKRDLPLTSFYNNRNGKYGKHSYCSDCQNKARKAWAELKPEKHWLIQRNAMLRKYGLETHDYNEIMKQQNNVCAICKKNDCKRMLHVDHNHETGKVRALLCVRCNQMIGAALENPENLINGAKYLEHHNKYEK